MRNIQLDEFKLLRTTFPKLTVLLTFSIIISGCGSFQSIMSSSVFDEASENHESVAQQRLTLSQATSSNTEPDRASPNNKAGRNESTITTASKASVIQPKSPSQSKSSIEGKPRITRSAERAANNVMRPAAAITQTVAVDPQDSVITKPLETEKTANASSQNTNTTASTPVAQVAFPAEALAPTTVEQINRLTEETPTAAGIAATNIVVKDPEPTTIDSMAVVAEKTLAANMETNKPHKIRHVNPNKAFKRKAVGIWTVEKSQEGQYAGICRISTPTRQLSQPDYSTQLWLNIINDELIVNTSTRVDIKQQRVGVKTNNEALTPFSKSIYSDTVVWSGNLAEILKKSDQLDIVIGGSELGKKTITTSFNMKNLKNAYSAYGDCRY